MDVTVALESGTDSWQPVCHPKWQVPDCRYELLVQLTHILIKRKKIVHLDIHWQRPNTTILTSDHYGATKYIDDCVIEHTEMGQTYPSLIRL